MSRDFNKTNQGRSTQGKLVNIKTVLLLEDVRQYVHDNFDGACIVGAVHDEEGKVRHCHVVVRFVGVTRWAKLAQWLHERDGHEYAEPAQSWRRSVRYLLHLDNPEKALIPRDALVSENIDDSELSQLLGASKLPILESLIAAQSLPVHRRFEFLVCERGHHPSEVSAAIRCMLDIEKWERTRSALGLAESALPRGVVESDDSTPQELEEMGLFDDEGAPVDIYD